MSVSLYPHQVTALGALRNSFATGHRAPMLSAPTGFGKTVVAAEIARGALDKGRRVAFVVPFLSLIDQTVERFEQFGITDVGVIQGDHPLYDPLAPVQICSRDTLSRRNQHPDCDLVVVDEAHVNSKWLFEWIASDEAKRFIGLSATPFTKGLGKHFDDLVIGGTTGHLIDEGFLSSFRVFAPSSPDMQGVKVVAGEYHRGQSSERMQDDGLTADIVETWLRRGDGRPTLVFAVDRAHAKKLQARFESVGVEAGYVDAFTKNEERLQIGQRFNAKELPLVVNVGCLVAGVDWDVRCIVLARPTRSEIFHVQSIGRGLRTADGKDDCLILDHASNHIRLGFVTDIHHHALNDGEGRAPQDREVQEPLPKECPECSFLKPPRTPVCPECGFKAEVRSNVEEADGDLVEITKGKAKSKKKEATPEEKQSVYGQLIHVAKAREYSGGWVAHKYKERFGAWPKGLDWSPQEPTPGLLSWVKSRQIAYAKRRRREDA